MKRFWVVSTIFSALLLLLSGCGDSGVKAANDGKLKVTAGLPPIAWIVSEIGGDELTVHSLLPEGRNPHDYAPGPREVRNAGASRLFFTTGMLFEERATKPLAGSVPVIDVTGACKRIPFAEAEAEDHHHDEAAKHDEHEDHHHHEALDPHVWLSIDNAVLIAEAVRAELTKQRPAAAAKFQANYDHFQRRFTALKGKISAELAPYAGRDFYVYHPAFGYYAQMTKLRQVSIEFGGRDPSPAHLADVIRKIREANGRVIFVQKEFNPSSAAALARETGCEVRQLDPLAGDLARNFEEMTQAIRQGFARK